MRYLTLVFALMLSLAAHAQTLVTTSTSTSLADTLTAFGASGGTLLVVTHVPVTADITIPSNIEVRCQAGGGFDLSNGATLTVAGPLQSPLGQCFFPIAPTPGQVRFAQPLTASAKWWGAQCSSADDKLPFTYALNSFLNPGGTVQVDCSMTINNSSGGMDIHGFQGSVVANGNATINFTDQGSSGLNFEDSPGMSVVGLTLQYPASSGDTGHILLSFGSSSPTAPVSKNIRVNHVTLNNAPGFSLYFGLVSGWSATNIRINSSARDGVHADSSAGPIVDNIHCENVGDDCVSLVEGSTSIHGGRGTISNVYAKHSWGCVNIDGASFVSVTGVVCEDNQGTSGPIKLFKDGSSANYPANVTFSNISIKDAEGPCIYVLGDTGSAVAGTFNGVTCTNTRSDVTPSAIRIENGTLANVTFNSVSVTENHGTCFELLGSGSVFLNTVSAANCGGGGVLVNGSANIVGKGISIWNASTSGGLHRSLWIDGASYVNIDGLQVTDTQATPTGYNSGISAASAVGRISYSFVEIDTAHMMNFYNGTTGIVATHVQ